MSSKLEDFATVGRRWGFTSHTTTSSYAKAYFKVLCNMTGLKEEIQYSKDHVFTDDHLLELTPEDIVSLFKLKLFGAIESDINIVPFLLIGWNIQTQCENLTKSVLVKNFILLRKYSEVCIPCFIYISVSYNYKNWQFALFYDEQFSPSWSLSLYTESKNETAVEPVVILRS